MLLTSHTGDTAHRYYSEPVVLPSSSEQIRRSKQHTDRKLGHTARLICLSRALSTAS